MKATMKTMPITSFEPEISGENESRRRAESADAKAIEPEIVEEAPKTEAQFSIDPSKMHALMVRVVKGLVLRVDQKLSWTEHPSDDWFETTTEVTEILLEKWMGKIATSPEVLFVFNITAGWILPNLLASMDREEAAATAAAAGASIEPAAQTAAA